MFFFPQFSVFLFYYYLGYFAVDFMPSCVSTNPISWKETVECQLSVVSMHVCVCVYPWQTELLAVMVAAKVIGCVAMCLQEAHFGKVWLSKVLCYEFPCLAFYYFLNNSLGKWNVYMWCFMIGALPAGNIYLHDTGDVVLKPTVYQ